MGNRGGALHDHQREIVRRFKTKRWIACVLVFKNRHRVVMSPRRYTELFFLDEAVAFAAGHRPCAECRRGRFNAFKKAWQSAPELARAVAPTADEMDAELHRARFERTFEKVTYQAPLHSLPDGCFVRIGGSAHLIWDDALFLWAPEGYTKRDRTPRDLVVDVLTPQPIVHCFRAGYVPQIHDSWRTARCVPWSDSHPRL